MLRTAIKLLLIFFLVSAGVHIWYGRLEKGLSAGHGQKSGQKAASKIAAQGNRQKTGQPAAVAPTAKPGKTGESVQAGKGGQQDFQIIVQRNIFQAALDSAVKEAKPIQQRVVPTALNLTLLGTVTGDRETARAIIVDNTKKQQDIFQIGDAVQGAFIETIERGKVTLDVNGKMEALVMKEREGGGPGPPKVKRSSPATNRRKPTPAQAPASYEEGAEEPAARKPPVRPHRRISFRRDPSQQDEEQAALEEGLPEDMLEDGLPPLE